MIYYLIQRIYKYNHIERKINLGTSDLDPKNWTTYKYRKLRFGPHPVYRPAKAGLVSGGKVRSTR